MRRLRLVALVLPLGLATPPARGSEPAPGLSALVPADPAAGASPDLRARIYVKDLDHLARIVAVDPEIGARARDLAARQRRAMAVGFGGIALSGVLFAVGASRAAGELNTDLSSPRFGERTSSGGEALMVASGVTLVAVGIYAAIELTRGDGLVDLVNDWNVRHPEEPLEIAGGWASDAHLHGGVGARR